MGTKHMATYSTVDSGVITYPVVGSYESNLVATWLVSTEDASDLNIQRVGLETCSNPDPCTCDALIVYEISGDGILVEIERICESSSGPEMKSTAGHFLLGFFSDWQESQGVFGFSAVYYPSMLGTSTKGPTTPDGIETTSSPIEGNKCGEVIESLEGAISYKLNDWVTPNERCVWVIQTLAEYSWVDSYSLSLSEWGGVAGKITVTSVNRTDDTERLILSNQFMDRQGDLLRITGKVLIVTFFTGESVEQLRGFKLEFRVEQLVSRLEEQVPKSVIVSSVNGDWITHPEASEGGSDYYSNYDLATFIYTPEFTFNSSRETSVTCEIKSWEPGCECCDNLHVFVFSTRFLNDEGWKTYSNYPRICGDVTSVGMNGLFDMVMVIFRSDIAGSGQGFYLGFKSGIDGIL